MTEKTRDDGEDMGRRRDDGGFPDAIVPPSKGDLLEWFYRC